MNNDPNGPARTLWAQYGGQKAPRSRATRVRTFAEIGQRVTNLMPSRLRRWVIPSLDYEVLP